MVSERTSPSKGWEDVQEELTGNPEPNQQDQETVEPDISRLEIDLYGELPQEFTGRLLAFMDYMSDFHDYTENRIEDGDSAAAKADFCYALEEFYEKEGVLGIYQDTGDVLRPIFIGVEDEEKGKVSWRDPEFFTDADYEGPLSQLDPLRVFVEDLEIHEAFRDHYVGAWRMPDHIVEGMEMESLGQESPHEPDIYAPMNEDIYRSIQSR